MDKAKPPGWTPDGFLRKVTTTPVSNLPQTDDRTSKPSERGTQEHLPGTELEGRFAMIPGCSVGRIPPADARAFRTLVALASHARREGRTAYVRQETLADVVGVGRRTVQRDLEILIEAGLVQTVRPDRDRPLMYSLIDPCGKCIETLEGTTPDDAPSRKGYDTPRRRGTTPDDVGVRHLVARQEQISNRALSESLSEKEVEISESDIEAEARERITSRAQARIEAGGIDSPKGYLKAALANDLAAEVEKIRAELRHAETGRAIANCTECDRTGKVWFTETGEQVAGDHMDASTADECRHGAPIERTRAPATDAPSFAGVLGL